MKHTYIFEVADGVTEGDLYRLAVALKCCTVSYKTSHSHCRYDRVQVFTDPGDMHHLAHRAGFSDEQLRVALPAARRRGDTAVKQASKRLAALRKRALHGIRYSTQMPGGTKRSKRSC